MDERPPNKMSRDERFTTGKQDHGAGSEGIAEHTYDDRGHASIETVGMSYPTVGSPRTRN